MTLPKTSNTPDDFFATVAKTLASRLHHDAPQLAQRLFGQKTPGYQNVTDDRLLEIADHRWADPSFRQLLLAHLGDEKFLEIGAKLGYYEAPPSVNDALGQVTQSG